MYESWLTFLYNNTVAGTINAGLTLCFFRQIITTLIDSMHEHITDATVSLFNSLILLSVCPSVL